MKKKLVVILSVVCLAAVIGVVAYGAGGGDVNFLMGRYYQAAKEDDSSEVLATYKDQKVTRAMVTYQMNMNIMRSEQVAQEWDTDLKVVNNLIEGMILLEEAERLGLAATEEEVEAMVQSVKDSYELPEGKEILDAYCEGAGLTLEEYYEAVREQAPRTIARQKLRDAVGKAYCEEHGLEFTKVNPPEEMREAVDQYIADLFESQKQYIEYFLEAGNTVTE